MLDLTSAAFDLSDRGVAGLPHPGPLDAYVWLDRGIYRPGETAQVMALLRDNAGRPADIPVHVIVKRPNGQVFLDATPARAAEASVHLPVTLSSGAPAGTWTIEVKADPGLPPIGRAEFRVDAFVPDRMAVELGTATGPIVPGKPYSLPVTARFLYGAPAAGLTGQASDAPGGRSRAVPGAGRLSHRPGRRDLRAGFAGPDAARHRRAGPLDAGDRASRARRTRRMR